MYIIQFYQVKSHIAKNRKKLYKKYIHIIISLWQSEVKANARSCLLYLIFVHYAIISLIQWGNLSRKLWGLMWLAAAFHCYSSCCNTYVCTNKARNDQISSANSYVLIECHLTDSVYGHNETFTMYKRAKHIAGLLACWESMLMC